MRAILELRGVGAVVHGVQCGEERRAGLLQDGRNGLQVRGGEEGHRDVVEKQRSASSASEGDYGYGGDWKREGRIAADGMHGRSDSNLEVRSQVFVRCNRERTHY